MNAQRKYVLDYCNHVRAILGRKPSRVLKKGFPNDPCSCPVARTIGKVEVDSSTIIADGMRLPVPKRLRQFLDRFDGGQFKDLIDPRYKAEEEEDLI